MIWDQKFKCSFLLRNNIHDEKYLNLWEEIIEKGIKLKELLNLSSEPEKYF